MSRKHCSVTDFLNAGAIRMANRAIETARTIGIDATFNVATIGDGNCFYHAIRNQITSRPEIQVYVNRTFLSSTHNQLRSAVVDFVRKNQYEVEYIRQYRQLFEIGQIFEHVQNMSWEEMLLQQEKNGTYVDILFIQATAVLLGLDIYVTSENSKRETPFTIIKSTWHTNNDSVTDNKPVIYLASIDSNHFQSLIVLPYSDHNYAMHMPAYQTHHQNYFIPASFGDCHVDFHRQVTIKKTHTNRRKKSNSGKFEEKMNKIKRKTKNASKKDKYNNENMSPTTVDVRAGDAGGARGATAPPQYFAN